MPSPGVSQKGKGERTGKTITQGQTEGLGGALLLERKRQTEINPEKQVLPCLVAWGQQWDGGVRGTTAGDASSRMGVTSWGPFSPIFMTCFGKEGENTFLPRKKVAL